MPRPVAVGLINVSMEIMPLAQRRAELLRMVAGAGKSGCQIVLLPEFADHHRTKESHAAHAKGRDEVRRINSLRLDSPWMKEVAALAKAFNMVVIPDVMLHDGGNGRDGGRYFNSAVVFGPKGDVLGQYRKTHLAPGECETFDPGDAIEPIATPYGRIGLLICYDINFPELTRVHEMKGAELLLWTTMRQAEHEEGLYRAVLPGRAWTHGIPFGVATYVSEGQLVMRNPMSSILYNCFGQVIAGGLVTPGVVRGVADLDEHPLERRTWANPEWLNSGAYLRRQRRPDLYGVLTRPLSAGERDLRNEPAVRPASPEQMKD